MEIKDILSRIGFVRNQANLSARELSGRMGMSPQYMAQVESGRIVLTVESLQADCFKWQFKKICQTFRECEWYFKILILNYIFLLQIFFIVLKLNTYSWDTDSRNMSNRIWAIGI